MKKDEEEILIANVFDLVAAPIYEDNKFSYTTDSFRFKEGKGFKRLFIKKNRVKRTALNNGYQRGFNNLLCLSITGITDNLVNQLMPYNYNSLVCLIKSFGQLNYNVYYDSSFGAELDFRFEEKLICISVNPTRHVNVFWDGLPTIVEK